MTQNASATPRVDSGGDLVLYVSNQSYDLDPVDIAIEIDGVEVVDQSFSVGNQHQWKQFGVQLEPGTHTIDVRSVKGEAELSRRFSVDGKRWAVVDFWYSDGKSGTPTAPKFTFNVDDKPIGFD